MKYPNWMKAFLLLLTAYAPELHACTTDLRLYDDVARERNAWAAKCGYVTEAQRQAFDSGRIYVTFADTRFPNVPVKSSAECKPGLSVVALCEAVPTQDATDKCRLDQLMQRNRGEHFEIPAWQRLGWYAKCGYLTIDQAYDLSNHRSYPVPNETPDGPMDGSEPCVSGYDIGRICPRIEP